MSHDIRRLELAVCFAYLAILLFYYYFAFYIYNFRALGFLYPRPQRYNRAVRQFKVAFDLLQTTLTGLEF